MEHHHHHHGHSHAPTLTHLNRAFLVGIGLNSIFVLVEFGAGYWYNSLALISDAGHNLSDVASLVLALLAYKLAKVPPTSTFTYGYRKTTVLVSLLNAVILLMAIGVIAWESLERLKYPREVAGGSVALVAGIGIVINSLTAFLFFKDKDKDLNIKGAYLHMAADALVSLGVLVAGVVITYTHYYWLDTAVSLAIVVVIFFSTWGLLRDSLVLSLDGVPHGIDLAKVKEALQHYPEIREVHHLHVWAISTTQNALTAHLVVEDGYQMASFVQLKARLRHDLEHLNIQHATLEPETNQERCQTDEC
ncbi:cation diffusion facilitator family transporter [Rhabdobacter roseus]|uniref:Cobalt-zinc-cadmium efflux system protein n=1 Tax=Rhabdobacter roseus TaxID=1655419 RepID=A0A840U3B8_9BACT|nr:cation diffusion facilitator family transporter [Rhabdobacter roseus]MBB5286610.1 cobalt-zinc-cadmium efflux system protein [Rhabdobacter roseus]